MMSTQGIGEPNTGLSQVRIASPLNLAGGYFRHRRITWKQKLLDVLYIVPCSYLPPKQAVIFFSVFFWPKIILLSISAHNTREQRDAKPCGDGHVQARAALIGCPGHRTLQSPAGSELIISLGFQSE